MTSSLYFSGSGDFIDNRLAETTGNFPYEIEVNGCPLYNDPEDKGSMVSELLYGEAIRCIDKKTGLQKYLKIINKADGYTGWIAENYLRKNLGLHNFWVSVPLAHLYEKPDLKSGMNGTLSLGATLSIAEPVLENGFLKTMDGYVYAKHIRPVNHWLDDPVDIAMQFLHAPYLWGGRTAMGLDCSALMQLIFAACGIPLHRDSDLQFKWHGESVTDPQRGDLAFLPGHVGIMVDEANILHANATHMKVTINPLKDVIEWVRAEGKDQPFLGFKRITA